MLERLHLKNVGPAPEMELELGSRLNLITGDNGLGKSFLLDAIWFALTRTWPSTWPGYGAQPNREVDEPSTITWQGVNGQSIERCESTFHHESQTWRIQESREPPRVKPPASLVIFARVDGGFSVWDPARKGHRFRLPYGQEAMGTSSTFQFSPTEVWEGLALDREGKRRICEGLWRDLLVWPLWPGRKLFNTLNHSLAALGGSERLRLTNKTAPVVVDESREAPLLETAAGTIPIVQASAAVKRVLALSYIMTWAWYEHLKASSLQRAEPASEMVVLVDEIESHLHPKWQRTILPALLASFQHEPFQTQLVITTHSPLVLASAEPTFARDTDAWFDLDLVDRSIKLSRRDFVPHGDVSNWLTSEAFDLKSARSLPSEAALEKARALLRRAKPTIKEARAISAELEKAGLQDIDPFWARWDHFVKALGRKR